MTLALTTIDQMEYGNTAAARKAYVHSESCRAFFEFNSSSLCADSIGGNDLTPYGSPAADASIYKQGLSSLALVSASTQYLSINDADLCNGFPLKTGDTTKTITVCCWIRQTSNASWRSIWGKTNYYWGTNSTGLACDNGRLKVAWGYASTNVDKDTGISISNNVWYHVAVVLCGTGTRSMYVRVYNDSTKAVSTYSFTPTQGDLNVQSLPFRIGRFADNGGNTWNGLIDAVVVFNSLLNDTEIDAVRGGTYPTLALNSYPSTSIMQSGLYALKGIASQTTSLNKTLTRTISTPVNLTGKTNFLGYIRSSRTGSNIKIGLHDSGGTTTEITPNIDSADTWQLFSLDISGVSDANKDAIDQIIITITNADAENTFYLDNLFAVSDPKLAVSKAVGYAVLSTIQPALNVSKLIGYAVLSPYEAPPDAAGPMMWIF